MFALCSSDGNLWLEADGSFVTLLSFCISVQDKLAALWQQKIASLFCLASYLHSTLLHPCNTIQLLAEGLISQSRVSSAFLAGSQPICCNTACLASAAAATAAAAAGYARPWSAPPAAPIPAFHAHAAALWHAASSARDASGTIPNAHGRRTPPSSTPAPA